MFKITSEKGMSRRGFLKGAGVTAAGAAIAETGLAALAHGAEAQDTARVLGPDAVSITLKINGIDKKVQVEPRTTLAEALRSRLDMTGTKVVCDRGACSACTVMVEG